jgi:hypothetical protein
MIKRLVSSLVVAAVLSGCAATYFLDGKKYDNEAVFQAEVESQRSTALAQVQPLASPLSVKKLIAAFPSETAIYTENERRHMAATGKPIAGIGLEQNRNLSRANFKLMKMFFEGVEKRRIYREVVLQEFPSMAVSLEPSIDYDVIYFTEPSVSSGQYFFASDKHGRQAFAFDRSGSGAAAKVNAFIEAVQAQAIRH